ncbi:MAG: hypothetical protein Q7P63_04270 [Verrucomicrobiota bacterium JB022]|nr:hypothetical protein [Verrucomicrobiota bacterium JB022]
MNFTPPLSGSASVTTILFVTENAQLHRELQGWCLDQGWNSLHCTHPSRALSTAQGQAIAAVVGEAQGTALDALSLGRRLRVRQPDVKLVLKAAREELKATDNKVAWIPSLDFATITEALLSQLGENEPEVADSAQLAELKERIGEQDESIALLEAQLKKLQEENRSLRDAYKRGGMVLPEELLEREEFVRESEDRLSTRAQDLTEREEEIAMREENVRDLEQRLRDLARQYFSGEASHELQDQLDNLVHFEAGVRAS